MRFNPTLSFMALVVMGCYVNRLPQVSTTGPHGSDVTTPAGNGETGTLLVHAAIDGSPEDCMVNVNGKFAGYTGEHITVSTGTHTVTVGDITDLSHDGLPLHDRDGKKFGIPEIEVTVVADQVTEEAFDLNYSRRWGDMSCRRTMYDGRVIEFNNPDVAIIDSTYFQIDKLWSQAQLVVNGTNFDIVGDTGDDIGTPIILNEEFTANGFVFDYTTDAFPDDLDFIECWST
ncbi:MAG: hypothetical protein O3B64_03700 [bacterium]|nr:hypothetical protein [bacterium]